MLLAASGDLDPDAFRETEIFKRCVAAGIIPGSMEDLEIKVLSTTPGTSSMSTDPPASKATMSRSIDSVVP